MASSYVGGLSGAFIPVSEDQGMIDAVNAGALTIEKLEAMTCVCSVGLDMIAIPGDTKATTISGIIADEMAIGMVNQKTTAVRIIPVIGKGVGETVEFGGLLGYAPIMPVNTFSCDAFVNRGGRIPAPSIALRTKLKVTSHAKIERNTSVGACSHKRLFRSIFYTATAVNEINVERPLRHIYELSAWLVT